MSSSRNGLSSVLIGAAIAALLAGMSQAASLTLTVGSAQGSAGGDAVVPISVQGSQGLGALQMELVYDPAVLEPKAVEEGSVLPPAVMDDNPAVAGRWKVGLAVNKPFAADGELLKFRFKVRGGSKSGLGLENAHAWDQSNPPLEMLVRVQGGSVVVGGGLGWAVYAGIGGAAALLLLVVLVAGRKKRPVSASAAPPPPPPPSPA